MRDYAFLKRRSSPGQSPTCGGFTLVELLVVLVVIGVVVVAIQLNLFSDDARRLRNEGERMAALITALADEAVTSGRPLAMSFNGDGYAFWEKDAQQADTWLLRPGDELFVGRHLPDGIHLLEVRVRQRPISLTTTTLERVIFSPSGIHPPFFILLALGDLRVQVVSDAIGNLRVEDDFGRESSP